MKKTKKYWYNSRNPYTSYIKGASDLWCFSSWVSNGKYSAATTRCHLKTQLTAIQHKITYFVRLTCTNNCLGELRMFLALSDTAKSRPLHRRKPSSIHWPSSSGSYRRAVHPQRWGHMAGPSGSDPEKVPVLSPHVTSTKAGRAQMQAELSSAAATSVSLLSQLVLCRVCSPMHLTVLFLKASASIIQPQGICVLSPWASTHPGRPLNFAGQQKRVHHQPVLSAILHFPCYHLP